MDQRYKGRISYYFENTNTGFIRPDKPGIDLTFVAPENLKPLIKDGMIITYATKRTQKGLVAINLELV